MFDLVIEEVKAKLKANEPLTIIDVREKWEYDEEHIPSAKNIPLDQITTLNIDKDTKIYVYCHSGQRANSAKRKLEALGYQNVVNLGGMVQWNKK